MHPLGAKPGKKITLRPYFNQKVKVFGLPIDVIVVSTCSLEQKVETGSKQGITTSQEIIRQGFQKKIEVASRFDKSNRLYQNEAFTPLLLQGSGGVHPLKISKFQCPKMRFPAFWALN